MNALHLALLSCHIHLCFHARKIYTATQIIWTMNRLLLIILGFLCMRRLEFCSTMRLCPPCCGSHSLPETSVKMCPKTRFRPRAEMGQHRLAPPFLGKPGGTSAGVPVRNRPEQCSAKSLIKTCELVMTASSGGVSFSTSTVVSASLWNTSQRLRRLAGVLWRSNIKFQKKEKLTESAVVNNKNVIMR